MDEQPTSPLEGSKTKQAPEPFKPLPPDRASRPVHRTIFTVFPSSAPARPMTSRILLFGLSLALASSLSVLAKAAPEGTQEAALEIDRILSTYQQAQGVKANPPIPDETFLRRIYLDLAGRIPTSEEAEAFLKSGSSQKRSELTAELLSRESYVSHFFNFWADVLRVKSSFVNTANVVPAAYARWLKQSLRDNKPYDQLVRELLSARGYCWENGAIGYYMRDPEMPLEHQGTDNFSFPLQSSKHRRRR